jgi:hypothetical protein
VKIGRKVAIGAGVLGVLAIGLGIGAAGAGPKTGVSTPAPTVTVAAPAATVTVTARPKAPPRAAVASPHTSMAGDGLYVVGTDIEPGIYHTSGAANGSAGDCYYALLSSTDTSAILDNNNVTGPATITVGAGVKAVDLSGCDTWTRTG